MSTTTTCPPCDTISCANEGDFAIYDLMDASMFRNGIFSFVLNCPTGYTCYSPQPRTILIAADSLPPIITQPPGTANPLPLQIQGCSSVITRQPPNNATAAQIQALVDEMFLEAATQQAACDNLLSPGPGIPAPTLTGAGPVDVTNTAQSFTAECVPPATGDPVTITVPAGTIHITVADPTAAHIASVQSLINAQALSDATAQAQAALVCTPAFDCTTTPASIGAAVWVPSGATPCKTLLITAGSGTFSLDSTVCSSNYIETVTTMCNPGDAYAFAVNIPWSYSGGSHFGPKTIQGQLEINGVVIGVEGEGVSTRNHDTGPFTPLTLAGTLPATSLSTLKIRIVLGDLPNPTYEIHGTITLTPLTPP